MDEMRSFITLTTDFGLGDPYVASMKGSIYNVNPEATIIDVSHEIRPQAIEQGAFVLEYALPYLPARSVHVMVVDPGVGTERAALALLTPESAFVGPDNGLFSVALPEEVRATVQTDRAAPVDLPPGFLAYRLENDEFHRRPVSVTFHGRDIFAPVAAHLSLGVAPERLGPPASHVLALPPFRAREEEGGTLRGRVVHIDRYGNLLTNVRGEQLPSSRELVIEYAGRTIEGVSRTYAEAEGLTAIVASAGFLAIVVPNGDAARETATDIGEPLTIRPA